MPPTQPPQGPYKLVTVNTSPERANRLIGRLVKDVKDKHLIVHAANAEAIDNVVPLVSEHKPDLLPIFPGYLNHPNASKDQLRLFTHEGSPADTTSNIVMCFNVDPSRKSTYSEHRARNRSANTDLRVAIGLQVEKGPDAVIEYFKKKLDNIIGGKLGLGLENCGK